MAKKNCKGLSVKVDGDRVQDALNELERNKDIYGMPNQDEHQDEHLDEHLDNSNKIHSVELIGQENRRADKFESERGKDQATTALDKEKAKIRKGISDELK